jgi:hypothetical protein
MGQEYAAGITGVVTLYQDDYSPTEAAEWLAAIRVGVMPSDKAYWSLQRAEWLYRMAAHLGGLEDFDVAHGLMKAARETLREIALAWLEYRACPCCVALRTKLTAEES